MSDARLEIVGWRQFVETDEPTAQAIIGSPRHNVLPVGGTMMLYGDAGSSKTTLTVDLGHHLAGGAEWLGLPVPARRRVLLIEAEGSRGAFRLDGRERLEAWEGADLDDWLFAMNEPWAAFSFDDPLLRRELVAWAREVSPDVIIGGPLVELGATPTGAPGEVSAFVRLLAEVREAVGHPLAFALVHHENVTGRLSGAWQRVPQTLVHATAQGPGRLGLFWQKVRHDSELHLQRWKVLWAPGRSFAIDDTPEITADDLRAGVLDAVRANEDCSQRRVVEVCGDGDRPLPKDRVEAMVKELLGAGALVNTGGEHRFKLRVSEAYDGQETLPLDRVSGGSGHSQDTPSGPVCGRDGEEVSGVRPYRTDTSSPAHTHADTDQDDTGLDWREELPPDLPGGVEDVHGHEEEP